MFYVAKAPIVMRKKILITVDKFDNAKFGASSKLFNYPKTD